MCPRLSKIGYLGEYYPQTLPNVTALKIFHFSMLASLVIATSFDLRKIMLYLDYATLIMLYLMS